MVRISLQEQYDNKDVIQQIYKLKDAQNELSESQENLTTQVGGLSTQVASMGTRVNKAVEDSANALNKATTLEGQVTTNTEAITQVEIDAEEALTVANDAVKELSITSDTVQGTLNITRGTGFKEYQAFPIANASQSGLMNAQTYQGLVTLGNRVDKLEASKTVFYVTLPSTNPSESEITAVFSTASGRNPAAGDYVTDIAKALTYGFNGTNWVKVQTSTDIPVFTTATPGLIRGNTQDGTIMAEPDGTGSVVGWDSVVAHISTTEEQISQIQANVSGNTVNISVNTSDITTLKTDVAGKQATAIKRKVTITQDMWSGTTAVVGVEGVTSDNIVIVAPATESWYYAIETGIWVSSQGQGTLTFTVGKTPTATVYMNVVIL